MSNSVPSPNEKGAAPADSDDRWRASVEQSFRNTEVREIANVLASLEPGASAASKLRLAMQFEDAIFKSAASMADYKKKLTKRLKKVQKSYKPQQSSAQQAHSVKEQRLTELKVKYKEPIQFILQHASHAVQEMLHKHGKEKAVQLKQHTDGVKSWALDLGLLPSKHNQTTTPNHTMSDEHLERLAMHLERRLESIRAHVVKLANPDRFLLEQLTKVQAGAATSTSTDPGPEAALKATQLLGDTTQRRYGGLHRTDMQPQALLASGLETLQAPLLAATRNQQDEKEAALQHLEKMRAASSVLVAFLGHSNRIPATEAANAGTGQEAPKLATTTTVPKQALTKAHAAALEGIDFVVDVMRQHRKDATTQLTLEDAWRKTLVYTPTIDASAVTADALDQGLLAPPPEKRLKTSSSRRMVLRSQVLLTPGRKTPLHLVAALKRKRAILVRPLPNGQGAHICLVFAPAFVLKVYLVPLVVTLRAMTKDDALQYASSRSSNYVVEQATAAAWTPLHAGLTRETAMPKETAVKKETTTGTSSTNNNNNNSTKEEGPQWSVWGCKGDYETVGSLVETRLQDASTHATHVLRKCFAAHTKSSASGAATAYDLEVREATALLEFLQLARTTYLPHWVDRD